jgi:hypothetical protein
MGLPVTTTEPSTEALRAQLELCVEFLNAADVDETFGVDDLLQKCEDLALALQQRGESIL